MEFEQLRQLEAIAERGTFSAAAQVLHISQPALSRSMQRLEDDLGVELFTREGRRSTLNATGRAALDWAAQILREERLMRESLALMAKNQRTLRVATVAPAPLWRLTSLVVERFPDETVTSFTTSNEEVERALINGDADLGIVLDKTLSPLLESCELMRENLSVVLPPSHPLAARAAVDLAELDGDTFLILSDIGFWRDLVNAALPHSSFIEQHDQEVLFQLARSTPHCSFATDAPFQRNPHPGRAIVEIKDDAAHAVFHLAIARSTTGLPRNVFDWAREQS